MPVERGYEQQVTPQAAPVAPAPSAESYGAGFGAQLAQAGEEGHRRALRGYQLDRQFAAAEEAATANRAFTQFRIGEDEWRRQRQEQGFDGYTDDVLKRIEAARSAALEGVREESVRRSIEGQYDAYSVMEHDRAAAWEQGQRIGVGVAQDKAGWDAVAGMLRRDPSRLSEEFGFAIEAIEQKPYPPDVKAELRVHVAKAYYGASGEGLAASDPALLREKIDAGEFDLLGSSGVRVLENRLNTTATREAAEVREGLNAMVAAHDDGEVYTPDQWQKAYGQAQAIGDETLAVKVRDRWEDAQLDVAYGPAAATPLQRQQRMAALAAKGDGRTQAENREYKWFEDNAAKYDAKFAANSMGIMITRGGIAPVDWTDPATLVKRSQQRRAASAAAGMPVAFASNEEIAPLRAEYDTGRAGQVSVLQTLDGIADDVDRDRVARQIAPQDENFRHLAQVRPQQREMVIRGQEAIKANPQFLKVPQDDPKAKAKIEASMAAVEQEVRRAFRGMSAEYADLTVQTAKDYLAGTLWAKGLGNVAEGYSEGGYRAAVRVALGGYKMGNANTPIGGIGHWVKTERPFVIPDGFSELGFEFAVERDRKRQEKEGRMPVDRDGRTPFDLKNAAPVMIRPGVYRWETGAGIVKNARGEDFISFVRAGE